MVDNDPVALAHKRQMEELHQFIDSKHLPPDLSGRVVKHFEFQYEKSVENRASDSVQLPRCDFEADFDQFPKKFRMN